MPVVIATNDYDVHDENYMLLAMKRYDRPNAILSEFAEDFKKVKYIKRQIGKYLNSGTIRTRLVLNHIIVLSNVFGVDFSTRLLYLKLDQSQHAVLKTFLIYLNHQPPFIRWVRGETILSQNIPTDANIALELQKF